MSGDTSDLNTEALGRGLGEFARNVTEGYNGQTPPPPGGETETGNGDAPPPPPTPATNTPPAQEQGQNWLMNLLAQKFGFSSGQEMMSGRSEEHTSELQSRSELVCRLLLEKNKK